MQKPMKNQKMSLSGNLFCIFPMFNFDFLNLSRFVKAVLLGFFAGWH